MTNQNGMTTDLEWTFLYHVDGWDNPVYECSEPELVVDIIGRNNNMSSSPSSFCDDFNNVPVECCCCCCCHLWKNIIPSFQYKLFLNNRYNRKQRQRKYAQQFNRNEISYDYFSTIVTPTPIHKHSFGQRTFSFDEKEIQTLRMERRRKQQQRRRRNRRQQRSQTQQQLQRRLLQKQAGSNEGFSRLNWKKDDYDLTTTTTNIHEKVISIKKQLQCNQDGNLDKNQNVSESLHQSMTRYTYIAMENNDSTNNDCDRYKSEMRKKNNFFVINFPFRRRKRYFHRRSHATVIIDQSNELKEKLQHHQHQQQQQSSSSLLHITCSSSDLTNHNHDCHDDQIMVGITDPPLFVPLSLRDDGLCPLGFHEIVRPPFISSQY
jgi:hypothetical protein